MLTALPRHPRKITAFDLQSKLDHAGFTTTKRTVERDLQTLSGQFPLTCDDRSKPYGWSWKENAPSFSVPGLSVDEALTLQLVRQYLVPVLPASTLRSLGPHFEQAEKILGESTPSRSARAWMRKVRIVHPGQLLLPPKINREVYAAITDALLRERQIKATYIARDETQPKELVLHPLALVQRGPITYLIARAFDYRDEWLYAVHRFRSAEVLDEPAKHTGFDLDAYIGSGKLGFGEGKSIRLTALFDNETVAHLRESPLSADQTLAPESDGQTRVVATVMDTPQLRWWLLGFGDAVEVLKPAMLRRELAAIARATARRYSKGSS
jgi:predicted DNA-binding transcriptional regulator YafY